MSVALIGRRGIGVSIRCSLIKPVVTGVQHAGIVSLANRDLDYERPWPYPYKTKNYFIYNAWFDKTTWRFDENSKLIVVDGVVGSGKDKMAKELAEKLDMAYFPNANMDYTYINDYGYDERDLDQFLPKRSQSFDTADFIENPMDERASRFQNTMTYIRLLQYIDALVHIFSTGQGVVMNRSIHSDCVFLNTMTKFGYMTEACKKYIELNILLTATRTYLARPHVAIYLDMPVEDSVKRINERNRPEEKNSPFLRPEVLEYMQQQYRIDYINKIKAHAHVLTYDWEEHDDVEEVVQDLEQLDFSENERDKHHERGIDWRIVAEQKWNSKRMQVTSDRYEITRKYDHVPQFATPELKVPPEDFLLKKRLRQNAPGGEYAYGYNSIMGDKNVWLKYATKVRKRMIGGEW